MRRVKSKIVLIDDEKYEKELIEIALREKDWDADLAYFPDPTAAFNYLKATTDEIFLIICDVNMPKINGLELKKQIDADAKLSIKSIPFIFCSNSASEKEIDEAYQYRVQGYFQKPQSIDELATMLDIIIQYWIISRQPNKYKV